MNIKILSKAEEMEFFFECDFRCRVGCELVPVVYGLHTSSQILT